VGASGGRRARPADLRSGGHRASMLRWHPRPTGEERSATPPSVAHAPPSQRSVRESWNGATPSSPTLPPLSDLCGNPGMVQRRLQSPTLPPLSDLCGNPGMVQRRLQSPTLPPLGDLCGNPGMVQRRLQSPTLPPLSDLCGNPGMVQRRLQSPTLPALDDRGGILEWCNAAFSRPRSPLSTIGAESWNGATPSSPTGCVIWSRQQATRAWVRVDSPDARRRFRRPR
jgi:hypothetical protein